MLHIQKCFLMKVWWWIFSILCGPGHHHHTLPLSIYAQHFSLYTQTTDPHPCHFVLCVCVYVCPIGNVRAEKMLVFGQFCWFLMLFGWIFARAERTSYDRVHVSNAQFECVWTKNWNCSMSWASHCLHFFFICNIFYFLFSYPSFWFFVSLISSIPLPLPSSSLAPAARLASYIQFFLCII